jgi:ParB-like chromosome segregation protein Spo0J
MSRFVRFSFRLSEVQSDAAFLQEEEREKRQNDLTICLEKLSVRQTHKRVFFRLSEVIR